ncbi:MAG TPA: succinylglutamate desuccinylase [Thermotogota bacterium]|nr:succinylglutamate desuccinylase [Thermotogota bacterium]
MKRRMLSFLLFLSAVAAICLISGVEFSRMWEDPPIFPSASLSRVQYLSDWFPGIKGSAMDSPVYVFEGEQEGARVLLLGGTHANEPAGAVSVITLVENIEVSRGTLFLVPWANHSAVTHTDPMEGTPQFFSIPLEGGGSRVFRFGSRRTNSIHQWPDPTVYLHPMGGQLGGQETLNLNRSYPGAPDGNPTEKVAYAILELIREEGISVAVDLHESSPEYPVNNAIVFHPDAGELAIMAQMNMEMEDIAIRLEESPANLRGLSHREWGDSSDTLAILLEVSNPSQGRMRGKTDEPLILTGKDPFYVRAAQRGQLFVPYDETGYSLDLRVARHLVTFYALLDAWNLLFPDQPVEVQNVPGYEQILEHSVGSFLKEG